ncbi:MAG: glutamine amidotransferase [bacterium]
MAKIYYAGDWAVLNGPTFFETPFVQTTKGLEIFNYGSWLKNALESTGEHDVNSVPAWDFYKLGPGEFEKILKDYDILIFSDIEAKLFHLAPSFFDREKFGTKILTFPDRIRLLIEAVRGGKRLMFLGGWNSFAGERGKGGWQRTQLRDILPVRCLEYDDLVETTEGFTATAAEKGKEVFKGIDFESMPPILGYNETIPVDEGDVLVRVKGTEHPLLAVRKAGKGKVLAYMSDPAPHWGCNFVFWDGYADFWIRCVDILMD